ATTAYLADFQYQPETPVDQSLDPFSEDYFQQQLALYREIAGRDLNQAEGERTPLDVPAHVRAANPYNRTDIRFLSRHARAIQTCLMVADLPPAATILDLGCGWGLSSEMMAFAGASVTAVDINPPFVELVRQRAARLGLPIDVVQSNFDDYEDDRQYDMVFFYECLHHSLRPWVTLARVTRFVKPGGKIVWGGEPVNRHWWANWGLRLDKDSVYCMRKFGWWESGWTIEFLAQCFARVGFTLTVVPEVGLDGTPVGFAVRAEDANRIRPDPTVVGPQTKLFAAEQHIELLHRHINEMRSSLSWRVAAPIRALGQWSRRWRGRS
ncbi:MAG: class I SAM-dependent methyltransferase, partial [Gemmataceae bacterium]